VGSYRGILSSATGVHYMPFPFVEKLALVIAAVNRCATQKLGQYRDLRYA
jgi:hypothetical protein